MNTPEITSLRGALAKLAAQPLALVGMLVVALALLAMLDALGLAQTVLSISQAAKSNPFLATLVLVVIATVSFFAAAKMVQADAALQRSSQEEAMARFSAPIQAQLSLALRLVVVQHTLLLLEDAKRGFETLYARCLQMTQSAVGDTEEAQTRRDNDLHGQCDELVRQIEGFGRLMQDMSVGYALVPGPISNFENSPAPNDAGLQPRARLAWRRANVRYSEAIAVGNGLLSSLRTQIGELRRALNAAMAD